MILKMHAEQRVPQTDIAEKYAHVLSIFFDKIPRLWNTK